jgi:hypothetical protein
MLEIGSCVASRDRDRHRDERSRACLAGFVSFLFVSELSITAVWGQSSARLG